MIEQNVQVLRFDDDHLWVRMGAQTGCSACDNGQGCGAGLFAKLIRKKPVILELPRDGLKVEAGQMLTLAFPERVFVKMVFTSYGSPLLAAIAGAFAGHGLAGWLNLGAGLTDATTLFGGILAAWLILRVARRLGNANILLNSLETSVYFPSTTPNICAGKVQKRSTINTF
jgi:sigma-E factor negative regulatory protein RseC